MTVPEALTAQPNVRAFVKSFAQTSQLRSHSKDFHMLARHRNGRRPVNVLQCDVLAAGAITLLVRAVLIEEFRHRALGGRLSVRHEVDVQFCGAIFVRYSS